MQDTVVPVTVIVQVYTWKNSDLDLTKDSQGEFSEGKESDKHGTN